MLPASLHAQVRPDFSGVWRLVPAESQMIGGGGPPSEEYQLTWLVNHQDPEISVVVNVRDGQGSQEYSFRCTTDGTECENELARLGETRRLVAVWDGAVLLMSQRAISPQGDFDAHDRLSLAASGERLIFERVITNDRGERSVRQVFRKLGPHPSQRPPPEALPSVALPAELARVLRDYEQHWRGGNAERLVALFTEDGMVARRGGWIRGQQALQENLQGTSSDLRLRAVAYAVDGRVGYIVGAYGYGDQSASSDRGLFILTLRQREDGLWLIVADLDGAVRQ
jgi:ketosteroid isomerase-like protein